MPGNGVAINRVQPSALASSFISIILAPEVVIQNEVAWFGGIPLTAEVVAAMKTPGGNGGSRGQRGQSQSEELHVFWRFTRVPNGIFCDMNIAEEICFTLQGLLLFIFAEADSLHAG